MELLTSTCVLTYVELAGLLGIVLGVGLLGGLVVGGLNAGGR